MIKLKPTLILLLFSFITNYALADDKDIVVVVSKSNPVEKMTRSQVIDLFMGKYVAFPDGRKARPADLSGDGEIKKRFYLALVNMPLARINSYWSRIKFTGRARPPETFKNEDAVVNFVSDSGEAIAYISRSKLNNKLKVVFEFHE